MQYAAFEYRLCPLNVRMNAPSTRCTKYESAVKSHQPKENLFIHSIRIYKWLLVWCDCRSLLFIFIIITKYFTGFSCFVLLVCDCVFAIDQTAFWYSIWIQMWFLLCHFGLNLMNIRAVCDVFHYHVWRTLFTAHKRKQTAIVFLGLYSSSNEWAA